MSEKKTLPYGTIAIFALWIVVLGLAYVILMPSQKTVPPELNAVLRPEPRLIKPFALVDQNNGSFTQQALRGKWSFVFFGYTYCPDICPTTLATLTAVLNEVHPDPAAPSDLQVIFVSLDPQRDSPEVIANYMEYFGGGFLGVTGTEKEINGLVGQFGAGYIMEPAVIPGEYLISHTSSVFLVDPQMRLLAGFSPPHDPATIADQFQQIRALD